MSDEKDGYPWSPIADREECCVPHTLVDIRELSLFYRDKPAFQNVTFPVYRGCITSLVGPSGCGKTSFLTALNRLTDLNPHCRVEGSVRIAGNDIRRPELDVRELRRQVGMIFQKPNPFPFSIRRNLEFPLREHGIRDRRALAQTIAEVLKQVGLWEEVKERLDTPALALSGGQQQRLCIARALCLKPEILLMDEPCSALDPISSTTIEELIVSLRGRYTVIIVTHNLAQARRISDHTAFFWFTDGAGQLIEYGPSRPLFDSPKHELTSAYVRGVRG